MRLRHGSAVWRGAVLAAIATTVLHLSGVIGEASLLDRRSRPQVLLRFQDRELRYVPRGKGQWLPKLEFRKVPPKPVSFIDAFGSVEGGLEKSDLLGFPFTTGNTIGLRLGFPQLNSRIKLALEDPPVGSEEEASKVAEAVYNQSIPGVGDWGLRVKSTGEWGLGLTRQVEDIGFLRASLSSQMDWNVDLDTVYPPVKGVIPSLTYGATQDGMKIAAKLDAIPARGVFTSYTVQNPPGKYNPVDFVHDAKVLVNVAGRHTVEATASLRSLSSPKPLRGSLTYILHTRPLTLEGTVDHKRYRLRARAKGAQVTAVLNREADEEGNRPAELELKAGKVALRGKFESIEKKPRVRLDVAL